MKLLITGAWNASKEQLREIESLGHEIVWLQQEQQMIPVPYEQIDGVICNGLFLYHPIEKFSSLKYIQLTSAGYDRVPVAYARDNGICVYNARGVYSIPMAEFALCGVLQLYKQSRVFTQRQEKCRWEKCRNLLELAGKNVCIVGCGSVGSACAKRFDAFDCSVTGIDILPREDRYFDRILQMEQLDEVLPDADIVVLTLPLTEETYHIIDEIRLGRMKQGAILVNIARGAIIDTQALTTALETHLGGAVLDVFEEEPLSGESLLWQMDNVILTPHNSFVGEGNGQRLWQLIQKNLKEWMRLR